MTFSGSQPLQNQNERENHHFFTTQIHQNLPLRQELHNPDTGFENSSFTQSEAIRDGGIPTAQKIRKLGTDRLYNCAGKFKSRVEYPLSVQLGAKQPWRITKYLGG